MKETLNSTANKYVGEKIRLVRQQKGWSQENLATRIGISVPALSKIETALTDINLSRLEQIANIFQIHISNLMKDSVDLILPERLPAKNIESDNTGREAQITYLQSRLISLYEELRSTQIVAVNAQ